MDQATTKIVIDWSVALPALVSSLSPVITGFLQQLQTNVEKSPWYFKSALNALIGGILGTVTAYAASGDALLSGAAGVILGSIGSVNISLRKGTRGNLEAGVAPKTPPTP